MVSTAGAENSRNYLSEAQKAYNIQNPSFLQNTKNATIKDNANQINEVFKNALFMEAFRNLNWSRGYSWYCELDGVPNPFNRGGVIGIPATAVNYKLVEGQSFSFESSTESLQVPQRRRLCSVNISFIDDEHATMFTFFERWFNNIYNSYVGVLPLIEACKCLSIYKLKSTRTKINRYTQRYQDLHDIGSLQLHICDSRDFIVYPDGPLIEDEKIDNGPRSYSIELVIVNQENPDYGNPAIKDSKIYNNSQEKKDKANYENTVGSGFLSKLSNYI